MNDSRGYLLPDGEAYTDELACVLLFYPDKDEYRRALRGALDYFGVWLAWERDSAKRGKDAARAWKEANEFTYECMDMNYCALILANLDAIVNLLSQQHCCDGTNSVTYFDQTIVTTTIVPGVGDPPASWGESEVPTDWDDWSQYVCYHAHLYVDYLIESAGLLDTMVTLGSWGVDFLSFILSRIIYGSPSGGVVPVNFGWVNNISNLMLGALASLDFGSLETSFEDAREDIVCAFMEGTSLEDAVETAVDNTILWNVYYNWLDYDSSVATIYTGEVEGIGYLTPSQRDDCTCGGAEFQVVWNFESSLEEWYGGVTLSGTNALLNDLSEDMQIDLWELREKVGLSTAGTISISRIKFYYRRSTDAKEPKLSIFDDATNYYDYFDDDPSGSWYVKETFFDPPLESSTAKNPVINIDGAHGTSWWYTAYVELDFDDV